MSYDDVTCIDTDVRTAHAGVRIRAREQAGRKRRGGGREAGRRGRAGESVRARSREREREKLRTREEERVCVCVFCSCVRACESVRVSVRVCAFVLECA